MKLPFRSYKNRTNNIAQILTTVFVFLLACGVGHATEVTEQVDPPTINSIVFLKRGTGAGTSHYEAHVVGENVLPHAEVTLKLNPDLEAANPSLKRTVTKADGAGRFRGRIEFPWAFAELFQDRLYEITVISNGLSSSSGELQIHAADRIPAYKDVPARKVVTDK